MARKYNQSGYKHYVVGTGAKGFPVIESGWEFKEDANDQLLELPEKLLPATVLGARAVRGRGLNPNADADWVGGA